MHITQPDNETPIEMPIKTPEMTKDSRRMKTALLLLCGCVALLMTGFGIIVPIFPQRLEAMGLGAETLALMEGAFGLGLFLFSTPLGTLADRIGRKPVVLLSLAGFIVTNPILAAVDASLLFIVIRFVEGALAAGLMPAAMAIVGDSVPLEKQGRWIGYITTASATGIALGPGIGGFLYQAWGFHTPFLLSAGIALIASLVALVMLPETLPEHVREEARLRKGKKGLESASVKLSTSKLAWLFLPLLAIDFLLTFIYPFVLPQFPFFFERVLGYSPAEYGVIISSYGGALAVFPMVLGRLSETMSKKLLVTVGSLLSVTMLVAMLFLHQYPLLIAATIVTGLGSALIMPALGAIYLATTEEHNRSQTMGIRESAISLGVLLGPLTQAAVGSWISPQVTFTIGIVLTLLVTVLVLVALKDARPQEADVDAKTETGSEVIV